MPSLRLSFLAACCLLLPSGWADAAEPFLLADEGRAHAVISLPSSADDALNSLAEELADGLEDLSGASFHIERNGEAKGILLGLAEDWPEMAFPPVGELSPLYAKEDYRLASSREHLLILGRTQLGLQNAVRDLLYRFGVRHYFPAEHWMIVPKKPRLEASLDTFERPDFHSRNLPLHHRYQNRPELLLWRRHNRMLPGFYLRANHMYEALIKRNRRHFEEHPKDLIPAARDVKLDPSSPTLRELALRDSLRLLKLHPDMESLSMEPSDGGNWRKDSPLGSPSNQAVTLANYVAAGLREALPERPVKVGLLAYHQHSPPPQIEVDRDVIVRVATAYISQGYTVEELLAGWKKKGAQTGVSEFLSIYSWSYDLPGQAMASDPAALGASLERYHRLGARHWNAQATGSWGPDGLGYYFASRFLWNRREAEQLPALLDEFYTVSFGPAAGEMRQFFETCLFKGANVLFSEDLIARMYRHLDRALNQVKERPQVLRLLDFVVYTRYLELILACRTSEGEERQGAYEDLITFASQHAETFVFNPILPSRRPPASGLQPMALLSDLSDTAPPDEAALRQLVREGIRKHQPIDFAVRGFSPDLVPVRLAQEDQPVANPLLINENRLLAYPEGDGLSFTVRGARLYRNRGPVRIRWFARNDPIVHRALGEKELPADGQPHSVTLSTPYPGLYEIEIRDGGGGTEVDWPKGQRVVMPILPDGGVQFISTLTHQYVFYVPAGTEQIGGYSAGAFGALLGPDGSERHSFTSQRGPAYFSLPVSEEETHAAWRFDQSRSTRYLLTVPAYLARNPSELLVPREALPAATP